MVLVPKGVRRALLRKPAGSDKATKVSLRLRALLAGTALARTERRRHRQEVLAIPGEQEGSEPANTTRTVLELQGALPEEPASAIVSRVITTMTARMGVIIRPGRRDPLTRRRHFVCNWESGATLPCQSSRAESEEGERCERFLWH
jgi:hypothetical protein